MSTRDPSDKDLESWWPGWTADNAELLDDLAAQEEAEKPQILAQSPWSQAVGARPMYGYHLSYKVVCYREPLTPEQQAAETFRIRLERGDRAQDPPTPQPKPYALNLIPRDTADYELAEMSTSVVYREMCDSGD